jgi:hypothetical protein
MEKLSEVVFSVRSVPRLYNEEQLRLRDTIDLLLLTDYDKRQTHPLVREGALPKTRQKLSNSN